MKSLHVQQLGPRAARCRAIWFRTQIGVGVLLLTAVAAVAQQHRDPFTQPEIDQIRDASWEPQQRLGLYVKFARARLVALEQMRNDPKTKNRAHETHDRLDDFVLIYDELNDNIDTYIDRKNDIRKPLKLVLEADSEFQAKLLAVKDAADVARERSPAIRIYAYQCAGYRGVILGRPPQALGQARGSIKA